MARVYKYRVYCTTDSKYENTGFLDTGAPTTCPVDTAHTIDASQTTVIDTMADNEVVVKEEEVKTGGHYQARGVAADVPAGVQWHDLIDFSWPFPVSMLSAEALVRTVCDKDVIEFLIAPDTVVGAIAADVAAGADTFTVQQSVIDNIAIGKLVKLSDGTNTDDCGRVIAVDTVALTIQVETAAVNAFLAATPTYVQMTTQMGREIELTDGHRIVLGESKIGGSNIPANTTVRIRYNNKDGVAGKRFAVLLEYLY